MELNLFDRGDARFQEPLEVIAVVRGGAEVTGVVAYDQAFARKAHPGPAPIPFDHLYTKQPAYRRSVKNQLRSSTRKEQLLHYTALE